MSNSSIKAMDRDIDRVIDSHRVRSITQLLPNQNVLSLAVLLG
jgi:hypothetical protein